MSGFSASALAPPVICSRSFCDFDNETIIIKTGEMISPTKKIRSMFGF